MNRIAGYAYNIVVFSVLVIFVSCSRQKASENAVQGEQRNVLFLIIDDLRPELGCYGAGHIASPNIDQLAAGGILFSRAYVQQAVCTASRASFLTGCRPDQTGVDYPYSEYFVNEFLNRYPTLQHLFFVNGYYTVTAGKVHHGGPGDIAGTDISVPHISADRMGFYALKENVELGGDRGRSSNTPAWECAEVEDNAYRDGVIADSVIRQIRISSELDQPFFIAAGLYKPHLPFAAPAKYWELYDTADIRLSPNPDHPENVKDYALWHAELHSYKGEYGKDGKSVPDSIAKILRHGYYACVSYVDAQVGRILSALKETGQYNKTIIVLIGDHGYHLGDHNNWTKHTNFERATRTPLIICAPGIIQPAVRTDALVEFVDIFPTLVQLTGIKSEHEVEGISLVPLFETPEREWKKAAFSQYPRSGGLKGVAVRTSRYRYVEWKYPDGTVDSRELYDHDSDPLESVNIAENPENKHLVDSHSEIIKSGWRMCLPPGIENHSQVPHAPPSESWKKE